MLSSSSCIRNGISLRRLLHSAFIRSILMWLVNLSVIERLRAASYLSLLIVQYSIYISFASEKENYSIREAPRLFLISGAAVVS